MLRESCSAPTSIQCVVNIHSIIQNSFIKENEQDQVRSGFVSTKRKIVCSINLVNLLKIISLRMYDKFHSLLIFLIFCVCLFLSSLFSFVKVEQTNGTQQHTSDFQQHLQMNLSSLVVDTIQRDNQVIEWIFTM
jgi:hypothetical protein